jgi:hypothetical protein
MQLVFPHVCPVCLLSIKEPAEYCRWCGCHLLLLVKVQNEALKWRREGKEIYAETLHKDMMPNGTT